MPAGYRLTRDMLDLNVTPDEDAACFELERMGKRFLIDFGTGNAIAMLNGLTASTYLNLTDYDRKLFKALKIQA